MRGYTVLEELHLFFSHIFFQEIQNKYFFRRMAGKMYLETNEKSPFAKNGP